jgi:uncharacterized protein YcbK (DUF882 family)
MKKAIVRGIAALFLSAILLGPNDVARAKDVEASGMGSGELYHLRLHHLHTGEDLDVVYRVGDTYLPGAIEKLNHFLRDHRTETESHYDPKEFDLLHSLMEKLGRPNGVIDIVCGYRTPWSNNLLRSRSANSGVAQHSQHMQAKAIDIRVPGVTTVALRNAALSLHEGGVGYYPVSQFVHVDVGPVREWQYGRATTRSIAKSTRHTRHHATVANGE